MKKQSYAVLSAAITATLLGGVVPALANDAVVTVDKTKTTDERSVEEQQQGVYQAVSQLMTHSDKAVAVKADAATDTAAVVAEKAADETVASTNKTAVDNNGFYVKNGLTNSYNSLTDMGLWIGGTDANTGFKVDTDGNVNTSGTINGFTLTQNATWTDHYGFQDPVDMINGIGFGQVGTLNEGTLFVKDLVVNSFESSGMTGGYVYLADGSAEKNNGMSTAIGGSTAIWGDNSVAIGFGASVEMNLDKPGPAENGDAYPGYQGTAIGAYSKVMAQNGSAFGYHAEVFQENGVALGSESTVAEGDMNVVSVGHKAGDSYLGGALLYDSDLFRRITNVAAGVNPEDAVTVGQLKDNKDLATSGIAKWDEASNGASINGQLNGVTLKDGSVTAENISTTGTINGLNFKENVEWKTPYSFWADTVNTINGVGFGTEDGEGTLYAKDIQVDTFMKAGLVNGHVYDVDGYSEPTKDLASTVIGAGSSAAGGDSVVLGSFAKVEADPGHELWGSGYRGYQGVAIGASASVSADQGVALGHNSMVFGDNGVALGANSYVGAEDFDAVSVGHKKGDYDGYSEFEDDLFRRITNVASGVGPQDAVTVGQLQDLKDSATAGLAKWDQKEVGEGDTATTVPVVGQLNGVTLKDGDVSANAVVAKQFLAVGSTDGSLANAAFGVDGSGNVTMNGALNGFTFTQNETWTDHYGFQDSVDMINGIGFGQVGTLNEGTLFVKDLVVNSFESSGMTGGYVYLADGSAEKNNGMSTAIGGSTAIWGDNSVAIGFGASVEMNLDKPGPAENGDAYPGYQGTAIGAYSKVMAQNGSAFGYHAEVFQENGVALGSESTVAEGDMNVVSVGHKAGDSYLGGALLYDSDLFRRITNVAAGVNPEDAVTVGQLKDNKDLATNGIAKWDEASNGASMNGVLNGVTLKNGNVTATDLTVKTINGKAADKLANVDEVDNIIGHSVSKPETFSLTNGGKSLVDGINSNTALIEKNATSITNITDGLKTAFAGVDFKKLQEISKVDTKALVAPTSYSLSLASSVPTSALLAEGDRPAPGEGSDSGTVTRPQPGSFDSVTTTGNATVGGDLAVAGSATISKDLTVNGTSNLNGNVSVGKDLTVTGKTNLKGDTTVDGKLTIKDGDKTMDVADAINKNQTAITEQNKAISTLGQGLSSLGKEVDSVGAISAALAGLHPLDYNGNSKFQLSAAVGTYDGTQAMAFGGFYHANPNVLLSLGASTSFGGDRKTAGNFGVTFRVGSGVSESPTASDNAALQDKLQKQQDQLTAQQKEIEELKAMVQNLTK